MLESKLIYMPAFENFLNSLEESFKNNPLVIHEVLANIFSMRIIGNKTHGDLAEIALTEYINQFVKGFLAKHTGKEKFRAKKFEEDIRVKNTKTGEEIPISVKAYGIGPLQLSTNKDSSMFAYLQKTVGKGEVKQLMEIKKILNSLFFANFSKINILPLIYSEKDWNFKIVLFNVEKAYKSVKQIKYFPPRKLGNKETFPIYKFFDNKGEQKIDGRNGYVFEVRYGGTGANALQRGMWTSTKNINSRSYFREVLNGTYVINESLVNLISKILVSTEEKHEEILKLFPQSKEKSII